MQDNLHVTLNIDFHEDSNTLQFHIKMDKLWNIPNKLILQPQIIPLCNPITSPAILRKLQHYKGRKQVEFFPFTSLLLKDADFQNMYETYEIIYDDKVVAFVDLATQKQIQPPIKRVEKPQQQAPATCSTAQPSKPATTTIQPPMLAEQLVNLTLHVQPLYSKPKSNSISILHPTTQ